MDQEVTVDTTYPAIGEIFELTLDADDPLADPIWMVRKDGDIYEDAERWSFTGTRLVGIHTRRFKLVDIGYQLSFDAVRSALEEYGRIPEGQWRHAFEVRYRKAHGGLVGFADSSWVDSESATRFPYFFGIGNTRFNWTLRDFHDRWLWVVEVSK